MKRFRLDCIQSAVSLVVLAVAMILQMRVLVGVHVQGHHHECLDESSGTGLLGQQPRLIPAPKPSAHAPGDGHWVVVPTFQPRQHISHLDITELGVRLAVVAGRVVGTVHIRVVPRRVLADAEHDHCERVCTCSARPLLEDLCRGR